MKLTIETYEIVTQLLVAEVRNAENADDKQQALDALSEIDAIGTY